MSKNEITPVEDFKINIEKMESQFENALPKHIKTKKFMNVVVTAIRNKPDLLKLNRQSLFNACMDCAVDGLVPDGREAALVPYKGMVRYTPMITGITKLARNSGEILTIDAQVVYENDKFDSWIDEKGSHFKHQKARKDRGVVLLTYAYAITKDGGFFFEEIDEEQMKAIEKCCTAKNSPWKGDFKDEMRRKSALKRLCKYRLPSSTDIDTVMQRDDDMYDLDDKEDTPVKAEKESTGKSKLEEVVDAATEQTEEVVEAEFKEEKTENPDIGLPGEALPPELEKMTVQGLVTGIQTKSSPPDSKKKWTKYGCNVKGVWYGSFSSTVHKLMVESKENGIELNITYEDVTVNDVVLHDIVAAFKVEKEEVDKEKIPI